MFQERIQQVLDHLEITPKEFAEQMGIQRSALSHILNGRNKPSLDFIIKLSTHFRQINNAWLLHGKDPMISPVTNVTNELPLVENDTDSPTVPEQSLPTKKATKKVASKVLIFYTDGTFEECKSEL